MVKTIIEYIPIGVVPVISTVAAIKKTIICTTNVLMRRKANVAIWVAEAGLEPVPSGL